MNLGWLVAVSGFALVMAGTPGPNNTMVTASGAKYGFRRTLPFMAGIALGVAIIILAAETAGAAFLADPRIHPVLKWAGLAYLLRLAWRIGGAPASIEEHGRKAEGKPFTVVQGALLQLVNPKLWAMVAGAVLTYGGAAADENPATTAMAFGLVFGSATFAGTALWALIGARTARVIRTERALRLFNRVMAGLLLVSLIPVLAE
jgi:threonine/homoserine/homoserine lactone efflux protein